MYKHIKAYKEKNNIYTLLRKKLNKKNKIIIDKYVSIWYNILVKGNKKKINKEGW